MIPPDEFQELAQAHLDGLASDRDLERLEAEPAAWIDALRRLRADVQQTIDRLAVELSGPERDLVVADFEDERDRIDEVLEELEPETAGRQDRADRGGDDRPRRSSQRERERVRREPTDRRAQRRASSRSANDDATSRPDDGTSRTDEGAGDELEARPPAEPQLQLSWHHGRLVAWAGADGAAPLQTDEVRALLKATSAPADVWEDADRIRLPDGSRAHSVAAEAQDVLGWLVALGGTSDDDRFGASATWIGLAAGLAVRLVAHGRMVPQLRKVGDAPGNRSYFAVRWEPTLIDHHELSHLIKAMPRSVAAVDRQRDARAVTRSVVSGFVDAICRDAARRVEVPAPPPHPQRASEVAETVLARLDGSTFEAPHQQGTDVRKGLASWSEGVTGAPKVGLIVQLDPPDEGDAWLVRTLATATGNRKEELVEPAMSRANHERKELLKRELERLEGLYAPLQRGKDTRRGQVILSQDEAWELMTEIGPTLVAAGFEVRVPPLSPRKARPSLKVTSTSAEDGAVGAQQLTSVRWSAVFDDVELTAQDIERLAKESRPLVRSQGRWVEVDHADLEAAAAALEERERKTELTGADLLRYALGLDGQALGSPVAVSGEGWAAELLRSARAIPEDPPRRPDGFVGELRSYQADALAWLGFLDEAGLGGCLALDMGLGKTPTLLAHLRAIIDRDQGGSGPALVIAPPAVVGNWAAEADRFVPDLNVLVHHGTNRASAEELETQLADADVLLTTYGTAVRDIEALVDVTWRSLVLDEAQVIKNPLSETSQQLRRLEAATRVVLTGTPIENGLGDLWALMDFVNPGLVGDRSTFIAQMQAAMDDTSGAESALRTLNGVLVFRRTKAEPAIAAELPDRIDELDHCPMTPEQIGLYQAVLDELVAESSDEDAPKRKGAILGAITALKQICNHPAAYTGDDEPLEGRSGKLARLEELVENVFASDERMLIFTHFASWGERLAQYLTKRTGIDIECYHGGLSRGARDRMVKRFQEGEGPGALVLSLKAGGSGLNLTAASHVVLYDRWWNPAVEDQARDRAWRIGQTRTVVAHRLVCPGTVDERVEEVVSGKRRIADMVLPRSSSIADLDSDQLRRALGIDEDALLTEEPVTTTVRGDAA